MVPDEHFTEDQIRVIKELFTQQVNALFTKIVAGNIIAVLIGAGTIAVGWYRLGNLETQVASVIKSIKDEPRFTQNEANLLRASLTQRDDDLQRQIDSLKGDIGYIRSRVDQIYNLLR